MMVTFIQSIIIMSNVDASSIKWNMMWQRNLSCIHFCCHFANNVMLILVKSNAHYYIHTYNSRQIYSIVVYIYVAEYRENLSLSFCSLPLHLPIVLMLFFALNHMPTFRSLFILSLSFCLSPFLHVSCWWKWYKIKINQLHIFDGSPLHNRCN